MSCESDNNANDESGNESGNESESKSEEKEKPRSPGKRLLEQAYLLKTPNDSIKYYDELADFYDEDFAHGLGYALPDAVASVFHSQVKHTDTPIVDIGCGTGLLGTALRSTDLVIDGIDISDAMLAHSKSTGIYRDLLNVDLTGDVTRFANKYGAVLSSGTFTHGHLGPDVLVALVTLAKPDGLFVIAINQSHYESKGFGQTVNTLINEGSIKKLVSKQVDIYRQHDHAHSSDKGLVVSFRKSSVG